MPSSINTSFFHNAFNKMREEGAGEALGFSSEELNKKEELYNLVINGDNSEKVKDVLENYPVFSQDSSHGSPQDSSNKNSPKQNDTLIVVKKCGEHTNSISSYDDYMVVEATPVAMALFLDDIHLAQELLDKGYRWNGNAPFIIHYFSRSKSFGVDLYDYIKPNSYESVDCIVDTEQITNFEFYTFFFHF